ncbi:MAG: DUF1292 domain-containing protein [Tenericutes bacterium HGW-Tenericutes-4]|nr:MAG: DUF1292 domain-containing protein [Tenericutes bacterium HGW-Tenericutes-4]
MGKEKEVKLEEKELRNPIEALLDAEDDGPIILFDEKDNEVEFDQVALIPYKNKAYAILKPVEPMEGVADDEAIVFALMEDENGEDLLSIETDETIVKGVFDEYYKLLDEE